MEWRCHQEIEEALWTAARHLLPAGALERKQLLRAITERTALYTSERALLASVHGMDLPAADLAARALFFTIADAAKISIPLHELAGQALLPAAPTWRVLDLGAGAGAMGLGILSYASTWVPGLSLHIDAVDWDRQALGIYQSALAELCGSDLEIGVSKIRAIEGSVSKFSIDKGVYDLVVLGNVLNEIDTEKQRDVVVAAMAGVHDQGSLIVVESALRESSRSLHRLRDNLIASGANIFAPCTRKSAPCPALADERDWCHEDRAVVLPSRARQMSRATGLRDGGLKFSYLVARHGAEPLVVTHENGVALRVVGQPQRGKGQKECFVCGEPGRGRLRLLRRNRDHHNRVFDRVRRGDVVIIDELPSPLPTRTDVQKNQCIVRVQPAERDAASD